MLWRRMGRSGRNLVASASAELVVRLLGLAYLVALARYLQPEGFGVFNALLAYFALAVTLGNFGLDRLALRHLAVDRRARLFATFLWLRLAAAVLTGGILLLVGYLWAKPSASLFAILGVAMLPAGVGSAFTAAFQARERFGVPAAAATASMGVMVALSLMGVVLGAPLRFFLWTLVAAESVRAAWLAIAARRRGGWTTLGFDAAFAGYALRAAMPYGVLAVLGAIYFRIDLVMLDAMIGGAAVGHYAGAYRVLDALILVPALILGVLFPRFARFQMVNPLEARALYLGVSRVLAWLGLGLALGGIALAGPILRLLFSDAYAAARPSLVWLMVALVFIFWHAPNVTVLFAGERLGRVVRLSFLTAGFNVVANLVLIPSFGAAGAAAATTASEFLSWILFTPMVLHRLGIRPAEYGRALRSPVMTRAALRLLLDADGSANAYGGVSGAA